MPVTAMAPVAIADTPGTAAKFVATLADSVDVEPERVLVRAVTLVAKPAGGVIVAVTFVEPASKRMEISVDEIPVSESAIVLAMLASKAAFSVALADRDAKGTAAMVKPT